MDIKTLQDKSKDLETRYKAIQTKLIVSETQRDVVVKELQEDFGIKPEELDDKIIEVEAQIKKESTQIESFQSKLEVKIDKYEGILNNA